MTAIPAHRPIAGVTERTVRLVRPPDEDAIAAYAREAERYRKQAEAMQRLAAKHAKQVREQRAKLAHIQYRMRQVRTVARRLRSEVRAKDEASMALRQAMRLTLDEVLNKKPVVDKCVRQRTAVILGVVCGYFEIEPADLASRYRTPPLVMARALVAMMMRRYTPASYPDITRAMGRTGGHSTAITAHQRLDRKLAAGEMAPDALGGGPLCDIVDEVERMIVERLPTASKPHGDRSK